MFVAIHRVDLSLSHEDTLLEKVICDEVSCNLSATLDPGGQYTVKFDLRDYAPINQPCSMTALLNLTINPLEYVETTYKFIKESFDFDVLEPSIGPKKKIHNLSDKVKSQDVLLQLDWKDIERRIEVSKTKPEELEDWPTQKLITFKYAPANMSEEMTRKVYFKLDLESGLTDALNVYVTNHQAFEQEFANLNRKTVKSWFENGMIRPARREYSSQTYNSSIRNGEIYFMVAINFNFIDFGILKELIQNLGGLPAHISFVSHQIEIYENKFNCQSNLLDSRIFSYGRLNQSNGFFNYYDEIVLFPQQGYQHYTVVDLYEASSIYVNFLIDQERILDLTIRITVKSTKGEIESLIKTVNYEAYKSHWVKLDLLKGTYRINLDFIKISECNNCDYFCEKMITKFHIMPKWYFSRLNGMKMCMIHEYSSAKLDEHIQNISQMKTFTNDEFISAKLQSKLTLFENYEVYYWKKIKIDEPSAIAAELRDSFLNDNTFVYIFEISEEQYKNPDLKLPDLASSLERTKIRNQTRAVKDFEGPSHQVVFVYTLAKEVEVVEDCIHIEFRFSMAKLENISNLKTFVNYANHLNRFNCNSHLLPNFDPNYFNRIASHSNMTNLTNRYETIIADYFMVDRDYWDIPIPAHDRNFRIEVWHNNYFNIEIFNDSLKLKEYRFLDHGRLGFSNKNKEANKIRILLIKSKDESPSVNCKKIFIQMIMYNTEDTHTHSTYHEHAFMTGDLIKRDIDKHNLSMLQAEKLSAINRLPEKDIFSIEWSKIKKMTFSIKENFSKSMIYLYLDIRMPDIRVRIEDDRHNETYPKLMRVHSEYRVYGWIYLNKGDYSLIVQSHKSNDIWSISNEETEIDYNIEFYIREYEKLSDEDHNYAADSTLECKVLPIVEHKLDLDTMAKHHNKPFYQFRDEYRLDHFFKDHIVYFELLFDTYVSIKYIPNSYYVNWKVTVKDENNTEFDPKTNWIPKGRYRAEVNFDGQIQHAIKCDSFKMIYTFAAKFWYDKHFKTLLEKAAPVQKISDIGTYYTKTPEGSEKGKIVIPFDIHRLRNRYETDTFGLGVVNDGIMFSEITATLDLTKSAIGFSNEHDNFMINVLDYKDVHFVSENSISLVFKYKLIDYKHTFNTDLIKFSVWPISLKGLIPSCREEKKVHGHRENVELASNSNFYGYDLKSQTFIFEKGADWVYIDFHVSGRSLLRTYMEGVPKASISQNLAILYYPMPDSNENIKEEIIAWNNDSERSELFVYIDEEADHRDWRIMFKVTDQDEACQQVTFHYGLVELRKFHHFECHDNDGYIHLTKDNYNNNDVIPKSITIAPDRVKFDYSQDYHLTSDLIRTMIQTKGTIHWVIDINLKKTTKLMLFSAFDFVFTDINIYLTKVEEDEDEEDEFIEEVISRAKRNFSNMSGYEFNYYAYIYEVLEKGEYKLHFKLDESMFEQLNHPDMKDICLSFNFEITLNDSSKGGESEIELEEIKETWVDDDNLKQMGDISLMGVFPHNIPAHALDNYLDVNLNFDQKITRIMTFDRNLLKSIKLVNKEHTSIILVPMIPNDAEDSQSYAVDLRYKITEKGCYEIKMPNTIKNLVKNFDKISYCSTNDECKCYMYAQYICEDSKCHCLSPYTGADCSKCTEGYTMNQNRCVRSTSKLSSLNKYSYNPTTNRDINFLKSKLYRRNKHDKSYFADFSCKNAINSDEIKLDNKNEFRNFIRFDDDNDKATISYTSQCDGITRIEIDSYSFQPSKDKYYNVASKLNVYYFDEYFKYTSTGVTKNDKKPLYSTNLDHYGSIIYHSDKNRKYIVKLEISMFDEEMKETEYLPCRAMFVQFSTKCIKSELKEMLTCERGGTPLDYANHVPPTNIELKKTERWWNIFKNDMVVHSQTIERTGSCDVKEVRQTGPQPKCHPYEEHAHFIDISVETQADLLAAVMTNFVSNDMRIELYDSKDKQIAKSSMIPYMNTYFGAYDKIQSLSAFALKAGRYRLKIIQTNVMMQLNEVMQQNLPELQNKCFFYTLHIEVHNKEFDEMSKIVDATEGKPRDLSALNYIVSIDPLYDREISYMHKYTIHITFNVDISDELVYIDHYNLVEKDGQRRIRPNQVYVASNHDLILEFRPLDKNKCYRLSINEKQKEYLKYSDGSYEYCTLDFDCNHGLYDESNKRCSCNIGHKGKWCRECEPGYKLLNINFKSETDYGKDEYVCIPEKLPQSDRSFCNEHGYYAAGDGICVCNEGYIGLACDRCLHADLFEYPNCNHKHSEVEYACPKEELPLHLNSYIHLNGNDSININELFGFKSHKPQFIQFEVYEKSIFTLWVEIKTPDVSITADIRNNREKLNASWSMQCMQYVGPAGPNSSCFLQTKLDPEMFKETFLEVMIINTQDVTTDCIDVYVAIDIAPYKLVDKSFSSIPLYPDLDQNRDKINTHIIAAETKVLTNMFYSFDLYKRDLMYIDVEIDESVREEELVTLDLTLRHPVHQKMLVIVEPYTQEQSFFYKDTPIFLDSDRATGGLTNFTQVIYKSRIYKKQIYRVWIKHISSLPVYLDMRRDGKKYTGEFELDMIIRMRHYDRWSTSLIRDFNVCKGNELDARYVKNLVNELHTNHAFHIYDLFVVPRDNVNLLQIDCPFECVLRLEIESSIHNVDLELYHVEEEDHKLITSSRHGTYNPELFVGLGAGKYVIRILWYYNREVADTCHLYTLQFEMKNISVVNHLQLLGYYKEGESINPEESVSFMRTFEDIYDAEINKYYYKNYPSHDLGNHSNPEVHMGSKNVVVTIPFEIQEDYANSLFVNSYSDFLMGNVHMMLLRKGEYEIDDELVEYSKNLSDADMNNKDIQDKLYEFHLEAKQDKTRKMKKITNMEYTHIGTMYNKNMRTIHTTELKKGQYYVELHSKAPELYKVSRHSKNLIDKLLLPYNVLLYLKNKAIPADPQYMCRHSGSPFPKSLNLLLKSKYFDHYYYKDMFVLLNDEEIVMTFNAVNKHSLLIINLHSSHFDLAISVYDHENTLLHYYDTFAKLVLKDGFYRIRVKVAEAHKHLFNEITCADVLGEFYFQAMHYEHHFLSFRKTRVHPHTVFSNVNIDQSKNDRFIENMDSLMTMFNNYSSYHEELIVNKHGRPKNWDIHQPKEKHIDYEKGYFCYYKRFKLKRRTHFKASLLKDLQFNRGKIVITSHIDSMHEENYKFLKYDQLYQSRRILYVSDPHEYRTILHIHDMPPGDYNLLIYIHEEFDQTRHQEKAEEKTMIGGMKKSHDYLDESFFEGIESEMNYNELYILQLETKINFVDREAVSDRTYEPVDSLAPVPIFNMNLGSIGLLNARYLYQKVIKFYGNYEFLTGYQFAFNTIYSHRNINLTMLTSVNSDIHVHDGSQSYEIRSEDDELALAEVNVDWEHGQKVFFDGRQNTSAYAFITLATSEYYTQRRGLHDCFESHVQSNIFEDYFDDQLMMPKQEYDYEIVQSLLEFSLYVTFMRRVYIGLHYDSAVILLEFVVSDLNNNLIRLSTLGVDQTYVDLVLAKGAYKVKVKKVFLKHKMKVSCTHLALEIRYLKSDDTSSTQSLLKPNERRYICTHHNELPSFLDMSHHQVLRYQDVAYPTTFNDESQTAIQTIKIVTNSALSGKNVKDENNVYYFMRIMLEASEDVSQTYLSKVSMALFNKKKQMLSPFNHLNVDGKYTSNFLVSADVYEAHISFPRESSVKPECTNYNFKVYRLPFTSWFVCPQDKSHLQSIRTFDFPHADNKVISDFFGFYPLSAIMENMNSQDMFSLNLRFELREANRVSLYFAYSGVKNVFIGGIYHVEEDDLKLLYDLPEYMSTAHLQEDSSLLDTSYYLDRYLPPGSYMFRVVDPQLIKNIEFYEESMEDKDICIPIRLHLSFSTNTDHEDDHYVPIHPMPDGKVQVDIKDDIMVTIAFVDDEAVDENYRRFDFERGMDKLRKKFSLVDLDTQAKYLPSTIQLIDYDDEEVEIKLVWKSKLFDSEHIEGYRLQLQFDESLYDRNNLHYQLAKDLLVHYVDQDLYYDAVQEMKDPKYTPESRNKNDDAERLRKQVEHEYQTVDQWERKSTQKGHICNEHGTWDINHNNCRCDYGYTGTNCDQCADGYSMSTTRGLCVSSRSVHSKSGNDNSPSFTDKLTNDNLRLNVKKPPGIQSQYHSSSSPSGYDQYIQILYDYKEILVILILVIVIILAYILGGKREVKKDLFESNIEGFENEKLKNV